MELVLQALLNPLNHGDVHISEMLRRPHLWKLRPALLHHVIQLIYRAVLSRESSVHTMLIVLSGSHSAQTGLIRVQNVMQGCSGFVPLLIPRGTQPNGPYAVMGYGNVWRPLRAWYANKVMAFLRGYPHAISFDRIGMYGRWNFKGFSDDIQQMGASREEQAVLMSKRTNALQLCDVVFDV